MFGPQGPTLRELARQALSSVPRGYDLLAPKFEHTPFRTPEAVLAPAIAALGPAASLGSALDLGCGTGAALRHLRPRCRERAVGVDLSAGMLAEARRQLAEVPGTAALELVQADMLQLPAGLHGQFDAVTSFGAFGHVLEADEPRLVDAVAQALRPGGIFLFVTGEPPSPWRPATWVARGFNAAMRVRNAVWSPPFVMYYLTFLLPRARALLEARGFSLEVRRGLFPEPFGRLVLVLATRGP
ncbi:class I SAM-dependent methyltransferase [Aggregicoccus sp. 17bor-14]|uniref:class I SAM-dependent DNA methyltransferase n=1 Tax=Myxococcaceae TaxID=31 RepID=UPI00129CD9E4|nr:MULTISPECIES: class I SAM-dependent methyltransferase [Myxococcaceae]MBF5045824.1 class I SAM-dependent methyltransferase [Simulacricoccus sp. 17bor-14]MRI91559.1 class I SAM-dependent methyltransferase [Aggregicoccus sp. 17bor-14]